MGELNRYAGFMSHTAAHYLSIYSTRFQMQQEGVTNPSDEVKRFTKTFVERLEALDAATLIYSVEAKGKWSFVIKSTGEVIAELVNEF